MPLPFVDSRRSVFYKWQSSAGNLSVKIKYTLNMCNFQCSINFLFVFLALQPLWLYFSQPRSGL